MSMRSTSVEALRRLDHDEPENERGKRTVRKVLDQLKELEARVMAVTLEAEIAKRRANDGG